MGNFIKKEGEDVEFKCRIEEEMTEKEVKMTWYHNDVEIVSNDKYVITFDGLYATLHFINVAMEDAGVYKVVFSNEKGSDETSGKMTVKEDEQKRKQQMAEERRQEEEERKRLEAETRKQEAEKRRQEAAAAKKAAAEKKPEPEPEPADPKSEEQPAFKLPKKKTSAPRPPPKEEEEEESPFGKIKLKKAERVKRTWDEPTMETVDLKHHEFERAPQEVEVARCPSEERRLQ